MQKRAVMGTGFIPTMPPLLSHESQAELIPTCAHTDPYADMTGHS